jgi:hypothetical protein
VPNRNDLILVILSDNNKKVIKKDNSTMHGYAVLKLKDLFRRPGLPESMRVWGVLAIHGKLRPSEIADLTGMFKTNVARAMKRLESMGYLKREGNTAGHTWASLRLQFVPRAVEKAVALPLELLLSDSKPPRRPGTTSSRGRVVGRRVA